MYGLEISELNIPATMALFSYKIVIKANLSSGEALAKTFKF